MRECWEKYPDAEVPLRAWYKIISAASWTKFADVKDAFASADAVGDRRIIFNIGGNKYRLVARVLYDPYYRVMVKFVGTHDDYNKIDPETV